MIAWMKVFSVSLIGTGIFGFLIFFSSKQYTDSKIRTSDSIQVRLNTFLLKKVINLQYATDSLKIRLDSLQTVISYHNEGLAYSEAWFELMNEDFPWIGRRVRLIIKEDSLRYKSIIQ